MINLKKCARPRRVVTVGAAIGLILLTMLTGMSGVVVAAGDGESGHGHRGASSTAPAQAGVASLDVFAEGDRLHLLIANRAADRPRELQYLRSDDAGASWSQPRAVGQGQPPPDIAHRGMDVQIAAAGDHLVAAWTAYGEKNRFGRGPIATAISGDGGKTWSAGPNPADDGTDGDHAFIDIAADEAGTFHMTWLDARAGGKGLLYSRSTDGGATWSANVIVKRDTCECCWNTIATAPGGKVFILYRDKDPRDMAIVRSDDGGNTWGTPVSVGAFNWDFGGCPHVGGGLAIAGPAAAAATAPPRLHAVVWTGKVSAAGAYSLASTDGGATWSEPLKLGDNEASHPDVACGGGGEVAAVWDAFVDGGGAVFAAMSDGNSWSQPQRLSRIGTSATHPRVVVLSSGFVVVWSERVGGSPATWAARRLPARSGAPAQATIKR